MAALSWVQVGLVGGAAAIEFVGLGLQTVAYQKVRHAASASLVNYIEVPFAFARRQVRRAVMARQPTSRAPIPFVSTSAGATAARLQAPEGNMLSAAAGALLIVAAGGAHLWLAGVLAGHQGAGVHLH